MNNQQPPKVYIPDTTYGQEEIVDWKSASDTFRRQLEEEYQLPFEYIDIGAGASEPAFVTTLLEFWPVALAGGLFFAGKKIEENFEAWHRIFKKMKVFFKHRPTFDRSGAAVLAVVAIEEYLGKPLDVFQLVGYRCESAMVEPFEEIQRDTELLSTIEPDAQRVRGDAIHVFQIHSAGRTFKVFVYGMNSKILES